MKQFHLLTLLITVGLFGSLLVGSAAAAPALVVDNFGAYQQVVTELGGTLYASSSLADPLALGGERDLEAGIIFGRSGRLTARSNNNGDSLFSHNQDAGVYGWSRLSWDGVDGNPAGIDPTGLAGIDLTDGGSHDRFLLGVQFADLAVPLTLKVYSDADHWSSYQLNLPGLIFSPGSYEIPFADFAAGGAAGGADFSAVGAVELLVDGTRSPGLDLRIHILETFGPANPGTGTPGYWMTHPDAWPVDEITIGGVTYARAEAIALLKAATRGDTSSIMFQALVAAKLNVLIGNDASCVAATISDADQWMADYGPTGSQVRANSAAWKLGEPLANTLDDYNNGLLCAPPRN